MKLRLNSVSKRFVSKSGVCDALQQIDLAVGPGEFVCLVGPSGCGKSTILNLAAGVEQPTTGSVDVEGRVGLMFQEAGLFPWLTVKQNIMFGLKMKRVPKWEAARRVSESIELMNLQGFEQAQPHELSGGMKQRVALARMLVMEPDILLMDEPFGALDAQTRERLQRELQRIWQLTSRTVVFITHDIRESIVLGSRVVVMGPRPGRIIAEHGINLERPRSANDPDIAVLARQIQGQLEHCRVPV